MWRRRYDLKAGEELFYHYGVEYWRKQITPTITLPDIVRPTVKEAMNALYVKSVQEAFLIIEASVEGRDRGVGSGHDLSDMHVFEAFLFEQRLRRIQQAL